MIDLLVHGKNGRKAYLDLPVSLKVLQKAKDELSETGWDGWNIRYVKADVEGMHGVNTVLHDNNLSGYGRTDDVRELNLLAYVLDRNPVPVGMRETVQSVEDTGNIQVIWDNGRCFPLIPNMDAFRMLRPSELYQEKEKQRAWLEEANRNLLPFQFECIDGLYRLSLPPISPTEEGTDHEIRNIWAQIFTEYFSHNPGLPQIRPEPEREPHCLTSKNPHLLESMGYAFKKLWEDFDGFREVADRVQSRIQAEMDMCF